LSLETGRLTDPTLHATWDGSTDPLKNTFVDANTTEILTFIDSLTWDEQVALLGRGYPYSKPSGIVVGYRNGDDYWVENNIIKAARLADEGKAINSLDTFWTLNNNNVWGHKIRFTNELGGYYSQFAGTYHLVDGTLTTSAIYTTNGYMIDNYTGYGVAIERSTIAFDFNSGIDWGLGTDHGGTGSTVNGFNDFFSVNYEQVNTIQPHDYYANIGGTALGTAFIHPPLNLINNWINPLGSTTTSFEDTAEYVFANVRELLGSMIAKTSVTYWVKFRKHF